MISRMKLEKSDYHYEVSVNTYSKVKFQMRSLGLDKKHPGRDALKEVLTFLQTYKPQEKYQYYDLALNSAKHKVYGRRFSDSNRRRSHISTTKDVEIVMEQALRNEGIKILVKELVYTIINE